MKHLIQQKPANFYIPITRVDPENRVVEGYCYTQPKVKGDKWNLKREALERASQKYMEMPALRAMHRPDIAAGVGMSVIWDEKGCLLRAEVVDDQEWRKVEKKVYRGFSIGGVPVVARGVDVEEFEWHETSLVDRPADAGAVFTMARAENISPDATYDVLILEGDEAMPDDVSGVLARLERSEAADATNDGAGVIEDVTAGVRENTDGEAQGEANSSEAQDSPQVIEPENPQEESNDGSQQDNQQDGQQGASEQPGGAASGAEHDGADREGRADAGNEGSSEGEPGSAEGSGAGANLSAGAGAGGTGATAPEGTGGVESAVRSEPSPDPSGSVRRDGTAGAGSALRDAQAEPAPGTGHHPAAGAADSATPGAGHSGDGSEPNVTESDLTESDSPDPVATDSNAEVTAETANDGSETSASSPPQEDAPGPASDAGAPASEPDGDEPGAADNAQRLDSGPSRVADSHGADSHGADSRGADADGQIERLHRAAQATVHDVVTLLKSPTRPAYTRELVQEIKRVEDKSKGIIQQLLSDVPEDHIARRFYDEAEQALTAVIRAVQAGTMDVAVVRATSAAQAMMKAAKAASIERTADDLLVMRVLGIHPLTIDHAVEEMLARVDEVTGKVADEVDETEGEIKRGITSETAPVRENLEGARKKVKRVTRFEHGKGDACLHLSREDAARCEAGVKRAATITVTPEAMGVRDATITVPTFRDYAVAMQERQQQRGLKTACRAFFESLTATSNEAVRHQSIDEFSDFMHDYVESLEEARQADLNEPSVPVWFDDYESPYPAADCCVKECSDPLRAEMLDVTHALMRGGKDETNATTETDILQRLDNANARVGEAETELVRVQQERDESIERVQTLERSLKDAEERERVLRATPLQRNQPVRFSTHVERVFAANAAPLDGDGDSVELQRKAWQDERERVIAEAEKETNDEKRRALIARVATLEHLIRFS